MSDMIEVPANEQRDIQTVTTEIRTLVNQYRRITVAFAVEIGRRLTEAKSLLSHGEWGDWLRDQVDFSQRTANNFMRVFEEYGDQQITLFGAVANSQTFANLSVSKALSLLALPENERETFVETNDVEAMSTRELNEAIKAKLDAERDRDAAEERAAALENQRDDLIGKLREAEARADMGDPKAADAAKLLAQEAKKRAEELEAELEKAKDATKEAKKKLKALKENPEISEEAAEKLRAEGAANAEQKAAEKLEALKKKAEKAKLDAAAAEERAAALEKQLRTAAPELAAFREMFDQVQADIDRLRYSFEKVQASQPDAAEKLSAAIVALAEKMKGW